MIVVYEPWARRTLHYEFNMNYLKIIVEIYKDEEVVYYGDQDQIKMLQKDLCDYINVKFENIKILDIEKENKIKLLINEYKNLKKIFSLKSQNFFIVNYLPHTILFSKILKNKNQKINGILHGLELLYEKKINLYNLFDFAIKFKGNKRIKYIVLGESILKNLLEIKPNLKPFLYSIDHPYSFENNKVIINKTFNNKLINIGTVGAATLKKGFGNLIKISNYKNMNKKYKFFHIGRLDDNIENTENIEIPSQKKVLSMDEYSNYIKQLDYILYFYPKESYKLTASGAIFDALKFNKPIIAIKNEYFEYIFNKVGQVGFLFDNVEEIIDFLLNEDISKISTEKNIYLKIENAKQIFSYQEIKKQLEKIVLEELG